MLALCGERLCASWVDGPVKRSSLLAGLVPVLCWAGWVGLICWALLKNREWIPGLLAFKTRIIKESYAWNLEMFPVLMLVYGGGCGVAACIFRSQFKRLFVVAMLAVLTFSALKFLKFYISSYEHGQLNVHTVIIESDKIHSPLTILHITDLEAAAIGPHERSALQKVADQNADLILFTGDLIELQSGDNASDMWAGIRPLLNEIRPPLGFYGVYGDGDGILYSLPVSKESPLQMLGVAPRFIRHENTLISLKGLSLIQSRKTGIAEQHIRGWHSALAEDTFSIVLGHGPDYMPSIFDLDIDLCLAGHTHGGQVVVPFIGPPVINSKIPKEYARGYHEVGNTRIHISAGLGSDRHYGMPIIRFGCPTEMTRIELRPRKRMRDDG